MKKILIIFFIFLLFPLLMAVEIDMKTEFDQGETFMAKVSGNFFEPIAKEDIFFYRENVRQPMFTSVVKINNDFYIYAQLFGKPQNNYSIKIENVEYIEGGLNVKEDLIKNFSITSNKADFSIEPGFVYINKDFFIEVENLQNSEIIIDVVTSSINLETVEPINLGTGETKKIYFSVANTNSIFEIIKLSTANLEYEIPVYIFGVKGSAISNITEETVCENVGICQMSCSEDSQDLGKLDCGLFSTCCQEIDEQKSFNFEQSILEITMPTNSNTIREIYLYNTGEKTIENISLEISGELKNYVILSTDEIDELEPDSNVKIELMFYSFDKAVEVQGKLTAKESISTLSEISLNIIEDYVPIDEYAYAHSDQTKTCAELNGVVCSLDEKCDIDYIYAKDNKCCLGICGREEPTSSTGKIIGWTIVGIVAVFLIWFFKTKYKGAKRTVDFFGIGKKK